MFNILNFNIKKYFDNKILFYWIIEDDWGGSYEKPPLLTLDSIKIPDLVKPLLDLPELAEESILMQNYIFHGFDTEDPTNLEFLEELFIKRIQKTYIWSDILEEWAINIEWNKIIIRWLYWVEIEILKDEISDKITRNSFIIKLNNEWKATNEGQKFYIRTIFKALRESEGFIFEYIDDSLKVEKNKVFREMLKVSLEDRKKIIKWDMQLLSWTINQNWEVHTSKPSLNQVYVIKNILSSQFANFTSYYNWLKDQSVVLLRTSEKIKEWRASKEMEIYNQIVLADFRDWLLNMWKVVEKLENDIMMLELVKWHQDITDRMKLNLEWWKIVSYKEKESKLKYWVKKVTYKVLSLFWTKK